MTFSIDNPEGGLQQPPLRKICLGKTLRRTRVNLKQINFILPLIPGGGGYSVERWVRGCAAQKGCIFSPTGFSMTPFYFKTRF